MSQNSCEKHCKTKSYSCSTCDPDEALCIECYGENHVGHILGILTLETMKISTCCTEKLMESNIRECSKPPAKSKAVLHNLVRSKFDQTTANNNEDNTSRTSPVSHASSVTTLVVDETWLIQYKLLRRYLAVHKGNMNAIFAAEVTASPRLSTLQTWLREQIEHRRHGLLAVDKEAALQRLVDKGELIWDTFDKACSAEKSADGSGEPRGTVTGTDTGSSSLASKRTKPPRQSQSGTVAAQTESVVSQPQQSTTNESVVYSAAIDIIPNARARSSSKSAPPATTTQSVPLLRRKRPKLRGEEEWTRNYYLLLAHQEAHGTYNVPANAVVVTEDGDAVELGAWLAEQRRRLNDLSLQKRDDLAQLAETGLLWTTEEREPPGAETETGSGTSATDTAAVVVPVQAEEATTSQQVAPLPPLLPMGKHVVPCRKRPKPPSTATTSATVAMAVIPQTLVVSSEDEDDGGRGRKRWFAPSESLGTPSQVSSTASSRVERSSDGDYFSDQSAIEHILLQQKQGVSGTGGKAQRGRKRKLQSGVAVEAVGTAVTGAVNDSASRTSRCGSSADPSEVHRQASLPEAPTQSCAVKRMRSTSSTSGGTGGGGIVLAAPFQLDGSMFTFTPAVRDGEGGTAGPAEAAARATSTSSAPHKTADSATKQSRRASSHQASKHSTQRKRRVENVAPIPTDTVVAYAYTTDRSPRTNRLGIGKVVDQRAVAEVDGSDVTKWDVWQYQPWDSAVGAEKTVCGIDDFLASQFKSAPTAHVVAPDCILLRDLKVTNGGKLSKSSAQDVKKLFAEHYMKLIV